MLALQFVPFLEQENGRLQLALTARGVKVGRGLAEKIRGWRKIMFPLLVNAFRRADQVSIAIQARGYDPNIQRTSLKSRPIPKSQLTFSMIFVAVCFIAPWI
jgi:energy-coupling factor transport system permease protein